LGPGALAARFPPALWCSINPVDYPTGGALSELEAMFGSPGKEGFYTLAGQKIFNTPLTRDVSPRRHFMTTTHTRDKRTQSGAGQHPPNGQEPARTFRIQERSADTGKYTRRRVLTGIKHRGESYPFTRIYETGDVLHHRNMRARKTFSPPLGQGTTAEHSKRRTNLTQLALGTRINRQRAVPPSTRRGRHNPRD